MNKGFLFDNELFNEEFKDELDEEEFYSNDIDTCLAKDSFYNSLDDRVWVSNVEDIDGGDNFIDYCVEFFNMLDEEEYYDN